MRFTYTAKRGIVSGHTLNEQYTLAIFPQTIIPTDKPVREQNIANDGTEENLLFRIDTVWQIHTDWINAGNPFDLLQEFLRSVAGGEQFTFDPYAMDTPITPLAAKLEPGQITYQRVSTNLLTYEVSFSLRMSDAIL